MKQTLIIILLFLTSLQVSASSPEEMYGMYDKDGKYREMTEQVEQIRLRSEEAQKEKQTKNMIILVVSLIAGLIPVCVIGGKVIRNQTWKTNPTGTAQGIAIALAGGFALFAFNYGWLYLKYLHEDIFKPLFSIAFIILLIGIGIYLARNKKL